MAEILVQSKIDLVCRVTQRSASQKKFQGSIIGRLSSIYPGRDNHQYYNKVKCVTQVLPKGEWDWRFAAAKAILCTGSAVAYGTYYGDIIGGNNL